MVALGAGTVVLVVFPFSDLSHSKLRPAVVLAHADRDDWILCQITSNPYADPRAIELAETGFAEGTLKRISYIRPLKLFTANKIVIASSIGILKRDIMETVVSVINTELRQGLQILPMS